MSDDREWLAEQLRERLCFYQSLTPLGFSRESFVPIAKSSAGSATPVLEKGARTTASAPIVRESDNLDTIRADLGECTRCKLHEKRSQIVFGVGNPNASLMFIGEGPGFEEDRQGIPFVGPAGQLLTKIIAAIDLSRDDVYIANVVKCRPPRNRDPEPEEVAECRPFLDRQVDTVGPKVICALGRIAAQHMLGTDDGITRLRGRQFPYRGATLIPTYHPAYLLRNPEKKRECWEDMKLIRRLLNDG